MKHADISGGNTITYAEWCDLMHHYYIAPPTLATCVAHPLDSARVMLKELLQRTAEVVKDNGVDGFLILELCSQDTKEVNAPKRNFCSLPSLPLPSPGRCQHPWTDWNACCR